MTINRERLLNLFAELVAIDSPSRNEHFMAARLKDELMALSFEVYEDDAGTLCGSTSGNVHGYLDGVGDPLLFCTHMDTVEPSRNKRAVFNEDGTITSAGDTVLGADDCAGTAAILEAVRSLREETKLHRPIEVLFTIAEEIYRGGASVLDSSRIQSKEAYILDLAGPVGIAAYQAPTILFFSAEITGKAAHAGFEPEKGVHAIYAAAKAICALQMGRLDDDTSCNIGVIEGGLASNIVPDRCLLRGEVRSYIHEKAQKQAELVEQTLQDAAASIGASVHFSLQEGCRAYSTPKEHPVAVRFVNACKKMGVPGDLISTFGGSDNNHLAQYGITGLVLATAMNQCHSLNEYTTVDELCNAATLALELMLSSELGTSEQS